MKTRVTVTMATVGIAVMLLTSCVSSRKYKESQANLQAMRNDSIMLAQKVESLNGEVRTLQDKNTTLQQSLDNTSKSYASTKSSLDYYQTYFTNKQTGMTQVSQELKDGLSQSGLTGYEVQQMNNDVYVYINSDDNNAFKKNSVTVTTKGQQALTSLATVLKNHPDVIITIDDGNASGTETAMSTDNPPSADVVKSSSGTKSVTSAKSHPHNYSAAKKKSSAVAKGSSTEGKGATAFKTGFSKKPSSSIALRTGRTHAVANNLVKSGIPKVNVVVKQPDNSTTGQRVIVIVSPTMKDFNPQPNTSTSYNR